MSSYLTKRITKLFAILDRRKQAAIVVISGNPRQLLSHDTENLYRPNSDLYYLTGSKEREHTIIIKNFPKPELIFLAPKRDPHRVLWEGAPINPKPIAKGIGAKLELSSDHIATCMGYLKGADILYTQCGHGTISNALKERLLKLRTHERQRMPGFWGDATELLSELRLYKDSGEIAQIETAAAITGVSMLSSFPLILPKSTESSIAATIEYGFKMNNCEIAFPTIVATGKNAAILHHQNLSGVMSKDEMVLIDCGAALNLYASDITRTLPVSGKFSPIHKDIYETVLSAQKAAIRTIKHGVTIDRVFNAAAEELTHGLIDLKILRGKASNLLANKAYYPYFPHGIGHSLGLDTHDVGNLKLGSNIKLRAGMVITVEPGLYFPKAVKKVPACGVRIEDDVLVTLKGRVVLSEGVFPKEVSEIEALT